MRKPIVTAGESVQRSIGVEEIITQLCHRVQHDCDIVGGKPFMLIFRRPRHKWESLALQTLKEFKAQLEEEEMMSDIQWIAEWKKPDDANQSVYREYGAAYLPSYINAAPIRLTQSSQIAATKICFVWPARYPTTWTGSHPGRLSSSKNRRPLSVSRVWSMGGQG